MSEEFGLIKKAKGNGEAAGLPHQWQWKFPHSGGEMIMMEEKGASS